MFVIAKRWQRIGFVSHHNAIEAVMLVILCERRLLETLTRNLQINGKKKFRKNEELSSTISIRNFVTT